MLMENSLLFVTLITIITQFDELFAMEKRQFYSDVLLPNFTSVIHVNACTVRFIQISSATLISNVSLLLYLLHLQLQVNLQNKFFSCEISRIIYVYRRQRPCCHKLSLN